MITIKELEADEKAFGERKWNTLKWRAKDKIEALKDVLGLILFSYKKCYECLDRAKNRDKVKQEHLDNLSGRLDELILLYSDIKGCNYNEAKEELKKRING